MVIEKNPDNNKINSGVDSRKCLIVAVRSIEIPRSRVRRK